MGERKKQLFILEGPGKAELRAGPRDRQRTFWGMPPSEGIPGYSLSWEHGLLAPSGSCPALSLGWPAYCVRKQGWAPSRL